MKKLLLGLSTTLLLTSNLFGTVYSDGTNPSDWKVFTKDGGEVKSSDGAIEFVGNGTKTGFYLSFNPIINCDVQNNQYTVSWKMKARRYSKTYVQIMTKEGIRYLTYYPLAEDLGKSGRFLQFGLDKQERSRDGQWHTFRRDVERDLKRYEPDNELLEIRAFFIRGSVLIDDVEVSKENNDNSSDFDFEKFDELLRAEDSGEWANNGSKTTIGETGNPRIKTRTIEYFMDNPPFRAVYTLSSDNRSLVEIVPNDYSYYGSYGTVKVSTDNKKLILDDGWYFNEYKYKEFDITDLPNIHEITNSKNSLYDIVGGIASNKNQAHIYEVQENGSTRDDIVGITEVFYNPLSVKDTFYMMNKSGGKAEVILQTEMLGNGKHIATINNSVLNIGTSSVSQTYDISKCSEVREGCAELISE